MPEEKTLLGWREWVCLPALHIDAIKAKIDTGAKTCALHAYFIEVYQKDNQDWLRFDIHPYQDRADLSVECHAKLVERRNVTDSGGHIENRFVIETDLAVGQHRFKSQVTLTDRENMRFRMLLGRNALNGRFVVDSEQSYCLGSDPAEIYAV
ncbi:ATP-dependent zinc protease [Exilibacterium tricleocarpae]|uniref:ATP-dependent zinc protease n=1 Tax=Exilibacterium tricleocarpae TaxID=2591008 RepID=A0A545U6R1_9GAMM|nr:ATP-dependent zinc protease [Exilibacterium tricleocarpae]TQV85155.1 ATP-dependent zinc protease [Exilibacterium tricleocarpae]